MIYWTNLLRTTKNKNTKATLIRVAFQRVDLVDTLVRRTKKASGEEQRRRQYDGTAMEL